MFNVLAKEKLTPVMTVLRVEAPAIARMDDGHRSVEMKLGEPDESGRLLV